MSGTRISLTIGLLGLLGCNSGPSLSFSEVLTVTAGQQIVISPPNRGPGEFLSPPTISSSVIVFDSVREVAIPLPRDGVPQQQFYFTAVMAGSAAVHFQRSAGDPGVLDLVKVP